MLVWRFARLFVRRDGNSPPCSVGPPPLPGPLAIKGKKAERDKIKKVDRRKTDKTEKS